MSTTGKCVTGKVGLQFRLCVRILLIRSCLSETVKFILYIFRSSSSINAILIRVMYYNIYTNSAMMSSLPWLLSRFYHCFDFNCKLIITLRKSTIFWDITPCSLLKVNRRLGGANPLHLQGRTSREIYQRESVWQADIFLQNAR
jgi:hypothetical protein